MRNPTETEQSLTKTKQSLTQAEVDQLVNAHRVQRITRSLFGPFIRGFLRLQSLFKPPIEKTKVRLRNKLYEASTYTEDNALRLMALSRDNWHGAPDAAKLQSRAFLHIAHALHHSDSHLKTCEDDEKLKDLEKKSG